MRARLGRSSVRVSRLGLGGAQIGNLTTAVDDATAARTVATAWDVGVRYFDTAPHYGLGLSERRLGAALRDYPRAEYVLSTKVGRLLVADPAGAARRDDEGFDVSADRRRVWDFSPDGVRRSLDESLLRLGLDRIDLALIHDPEAHQSQALDQAYPALHELRRQGVVGAIGVGSKSWEVLHRFAEATEIDAVMVAGRYTLLEQPALQALLPACERRGISVINAGVFNSGLLAEEQPRGGLRYEYQPASSEIVERARAIAAACLRHGTSLPAAALSFAAAHPAVATVVVGACDDEQVRRNAALATAAPPPRALWRELVSAGLLHPDAPWPSDREERDDR